MKRYKINFVLHRPGMVGPWYVSTGQRHQALRSCRRGSLVVEMIVCTILLATVSLTLVPTIHSVQQQRKTIEFESLMIVELNNQHQLLQESETYSERSALSAWFLNRYPEASLQLNKIASAAATDSLSPGDSISKQEQEQEQATQTGVEFDPSLQAFEITIRHPGKEFQPEIVRSVMVWVPRKEVPSP